MTQPTFTIPLEAGTYYICTCGQSKNLPYCDGSHQGSGLQPLALELESPQTVQISGLPEAKSSR